MSMIFVNNGTDNPGQTAVMNSQFEELNNHRRFNANNRALPEHWFNGPLALPIQANAAKGSVFNSGRRPADLFREFDNQTVAQFRLDEGDVILNDLMPLSRSIAIGRTVLENARASDAGFFTQSMAGEKGSEYDNVDYDTDKYIIPINQNGFKRSWREGNQLSLEQFDDAVNQQREGIRRHRNGVIDSFLDGHLDKNGEFISHDGVTWQGVRADSRVDQVDLSGGGMNIDFTSGALTGETARAGWIALAERRYITNKVTVPATYYVSNEIFFNFARQYSNEYSAGSILQNLLTVPGVMAIKPSSKLTGNQVLSIPLSRNYVEPITGMAVSTIARSRPEWNSPFEFDIVSAIGWSIKTDFGGTNRGLQYAAG